MKRFIFSIVIVLGSLHAFSQVKIGLQLSPNISSNRFDTQSDLYSIDNDGAKLKMRFGLVADFPIADNYYFSTGVLYAPKQVGLKATDALTSNMITEEYKLQYLQIPLAIKLYTNEISLDTRLYFNLGMNAEVTISEKFDNDNVVIEDFQFFDTSLLLGAGVEYKIGSNTAVFGGISYNRSLVNQIKDQFDAGDDVILKNDLINFDLGIKF